jgi:hypothetical protein
MTSRARGVYDASMLIAVVVLQAFRLTGLLIHEWLATVLTLAILGHLVVHWSWLKTRGRRFFSDPGWRSRFNFALNVSLLIAVAATMVSGFAVSKIIMPTDLDGMTFLKWRSIHGTASRTALVIAGLHLALNWDLLMARLRARAGRQPLRLAGAVPVLLWTVVVTLLVVEGLRALEHRMPAPDITMFRDGKRIEHAPPPPDVAKLHGDEAAPSPRAFPVLIAHTIMVTASCVVGRKIFRLRLE